MNFQRFLTVCALLIVCMGTNLRAEESETVQRLKTTVGFLCDEQCRGRDAGTLGGQRAAFYLAEQLKEYGLRPISEYAEELEITLEPFLLVGDGEIAADDPRIPYFQPFHKSLRKCQNVIALVPGSDPALAKEYVLVSAHYDHVGKTMLGNAYYAGANDNASGTACVLELARIFAKKQPAPPRTMIFAFWDAEEKGLHGSLEFMKRIAKKKKPIIFSLSMDMVGYLSGEEGGKLDGQEDTEYTLEIVGYRSGFGIRQLLARSNSVAEDGKAAPGLKLLFDHEMWQNSDHYSMYRHSLPSILLTSGFSGPYHTLEDVPEGLSFEGMRRVVAFSENALDLLGKRPRSELPSFRKNEKGTGSFLIEDMSEAERAEELQESHSNGPDLVSEQGVTEMKTDVQQPYWGMSFRRDPAEKNVLIVTNVQSASLAHRSGFRPGDRIYSFDRNIPEEKSWRNWNPEKTAQLEVERYGTIRKVTVGKEK